MPLRHAPAVARSSYVDPQVVEMYEQGQVAESGDEKAVRDYW
jgi:DNA topoisomerase IB